MARKTLLGRVGGWEGRSDIYHPIPFAFPFLSILSIPILFRPIHPHSHPNPIYPHSHFNSIYPHSHFNSIYLRSISTPPHSHPHSIHPESHRILSSPNIQREE